MRLPSSARFKNQHPYDKDQVSAVTDITRKFTLTWIGTATNILSMEVLSRRFYCFGLTDKVISGSNAVQVLIFGWIL
jgi:hypothetical protein